MVEARPKATTRQEEDTDGDRAEATNTTFDEGQGFLDIHRSFVLSIDDASRMGHSILGLSTLAVVVLAFILTGTSLFSLTTLWMAPLVAFVTLIAGRRLGLARQDRRLRARIRRYCREQEVSPRELAEEAARTGRYEFFVKLCLPIPG